ncbi:MAG TPA: DUF4250 domain-containing protein [Candidatus Ruminococcus avistercoris]|nr:DUF4250 domain-containing protein [Candidatus Ruminococcus avistercoris]
MMPKDPYMLLSYLNTQLRDHYGSLAELCHAVDADEEEIRARMQTIEYEYDASRNQFI